jgi:anthranilate phosphoribosyltransferase
MQQTILDKILSGAVLNSDEMGCAMDRMLSNDYTPEEIKSILSALAKRGETPPEIAGAARILRAYALPVEPVPGAIDCCGTGGDGAHTYNISTAVAFILAGCGVPVAKHGNRAASSKCGAADVLEELGVNIALSPEMCHDALKNLNFCFLFAPGHYAVLKPLAALRRELGFRTIFNLMGPLANPAGTEYQLLGVFDRKWVRPLAEVLKSLGTKRAMVVCGYGGLDEIATAGPTDCALLDESGTITEQTISPEDFGLPLLQNGNALRGGDAKENAAAFMDLLHGKKSAYRDIVLANAAAALVVAGKTDGLKKGVELAAASLDDGRALDVFTRYRDYSQSAAKAT